MKIGVDLDGVILRTMTPICEYINSKLGTELTHRSIDKWGFFEENPEYKTHFWDSYNLMDQSGGRNHLQPYDSETVNVLHYLFDKYENLSILTANNVAARSTIKEWLKINNAPPIKVICLGRVGAAEKAEQDWDVILEDNPRMAELIKYYPNKKMLLLSAPWNKEVKDTEQVKRVNSWLEIKEIL